jgi:hypothetical protein
MIVVLGSIAVYLLTSKKAEHRYWGSAAGLASEPFWLLTGWPDQWGIVVMSVVYAVLYYRGMKNNKEKPEPKVNPQYARMFSDDNLRPDIGLAEARIKLENAQELESRWQKRYDAWANTPEAERAFKQMKIISSPTKS